MKDITIFVVKNVADQDIGTSRRYGKYEKTIQSGCYGTSERIADYSDDTGDNISQRNATYSEFTAMYWVWKNYRADYIGWTHYRRKFCLNDEQIEMLLSEDIDIILPPAIIYGEEDLSMEIQFKSNHPYRLWNKMFAAINELYPDEYDEIFKICTDRYVFPCCLGIFKYEIFCKCCEWIFPILNKVFEMEGDHIADSYQRRYIAFLGERLLSIYWQMHLKEYTVKYFDFELLGTLKNREKNLNIEEKKDVVSKLVNEGQITKAINLIRQEAIYYRDMVWVKVIKALMYENARIGLTMIDGGNDLNRCIDIYQLLLSLKRQCVNADELVTEMLPIVDEYKISDYFCVAFVYQEFANFIFVWERLCIEWNDCGNKERSIPYVLEILRHNPYNLIANTTIKEVLKEDIT